MKGILMKDWAVRALLDNRKTVTRRVVKDAPNEEGLKPCKTMGFGYGLIAPNSRVYPIKPLYRPGDILYVRETWYYETFYEDTDNAPDLPSGNRSWRYVYKADNPDYPVIPGHWRPSIHMPREAARIFLRVTDVRVERLQDIDDDGVVAEGLEIGAPFDELWNSTIKPADRAAYGWDANPWVFVISFESITEDDVGLGHWV